MTALLVWIDAGAADGLGLSHERFEESHYAETPLGDYHIRSDRWRGNDCWTWDFNNGDLKRANSFRSCKAAAQAHYDECELSLEKACARQSIKQEEN